MFSAERALRLLQLGTGIENARFHAGQAEAIEHIVEGRGRLLVVQRTGWGKSSVYFIAARMLREAGYGPALLISPLLSLMRNQLVAAERLGVQARTIHSDNTEEWEQIEAEISAGKVDILLVAPERLANPRFAENVVAPIADRISLLVIDEAHCISDWGHDFRPHYRLIERIVRTLPPNLRLLATTATANDRVMEDLAGVLGPDITVARGDLNRPSLALQTIRLPTQAERLAWLAEHVPGLPGSGIIYSLTIRDAKLVTEWLRSRGVDVACYSGQSEGREELEQSLLENRVKALVATTALGMGFDKPDLAFVIHYQTPGSAVAYYQQVGRAGRALTSARGVLLSGAEEGDIADFFIRSAFPTRDEVQQVLTALEQARDGLTTLQLEEKLNLSHGRIEKTILLLALESPAPLVKAGRKWRRAPTRLAEDFWRRAERLTQVRRHEQRQMQQYVGLSTDHMAFLIRALDGDVSDLVSPDLPPLAADTDIDLVTEAVAFLRRTSLPIEPRLKWPAGGMPVSAYKGKIPADRLAQPGKALSVWGDAGWGELVRVGKYEDGRFADDLVDACVKLVDSWQPEPPPTWVTCIPSLRHRELVPDLAARLADALSLPFRPVIIRTEARPEQKTRANSIQQARNVDGALAVEGNLDAAPVLLVDDIVDSRWTLTVAAALLRQSGAGPVHPLVLAKANPGS